MPVWRATVETDIPQKPLLTSALHQLTMVFSGVNFNCCPLKQELFILCSWLKYKILLYLKEFITRSDILWVTWLPIIWYVFFSLIKIVKRELASFHHPLWIRSSWSSCHCASFLCHSWMDRPSCGLCFVRVECRVGWGPVDNADQWQSTELYPAEVKKKING